MPKGNGNNSGKRRIFEPKAAGRVIDWFFKISVGISLIIIFEYIFDTAPKVKTCSEFFEQVLQDKEQRRFR